jgi:hypothetical protein
MQRQGSSIKLSHVLFSGLTHESSIHKQPSVTRIRSCIQHSGAGSEPVSQQVGQIKESDTDRQTNKQINKTDSQTDKQTNKKINKTDRQTDRLVREADKLVRETDGLVRQTNRLVRETNKLVRYANGQTQSHSKVNKSRIPTQHTTHFPNANQSNTCIPVLLGEWCLSVSNATSRTVPIQKILTRRIDIHIRSSQINNITVIRPRCTES